jgi:5-methylcytosine-specific restriction endonuclease McrA
LEQTLVIDRDFQPIMIINWQKAFCLIFTGKAEVIKESDSRLIHSSYKVFKFPTVIQIFTRVNYSVRVTLNRWSIFARDNFSCAYCGVVQTKKELSLDHIHPVSKGGKSSWENLITACQKCNQKKSDKTAEEAGLKMRLKPYRPVWSPSFMMSVYQIKTINDDWKDFLNS